MLASDQVPIRTLLSCFPVEGRVLRSFDCTLLGNGSAGLDHS